MGLIEVVMLVIGLTDCLATECVLLVARRKVLRVMIRLGDCISE